MNGLGQKEVEEDGQQSGKERERERTLTSGARKATAKDRHQNGYLKICSIKIDQWPKTNLK